MNPAVLNLIEGEARLDQNTEARQFYPGSYME